MKRKSFEHYINIYIQSDRHKRLYKDTQQIIAARKRKKDALIRMVSFYPEETKAAFLGLMDDRDVWLALSAAYDYAHSFDLPLDVKKKILQTIKRCKNCRTCTGVEKVSLMILAGYVREK